MVSIKYIEALNCFRLCGVCNTENGEIFLPEHVHVDDDTDLLKLKEEIDYSDARYIQFPIVNVSRIYSYLPTLNYVEDEVIRASGIDFASHKNDPLYVDFDYSVSIQKQKGSEYRPFINKVYNFIKTLPEDVYFEYTRYISLYIICTQRDWCRANEIYVDGLT